MVIYFAVNRTAVEIVWRFNQVSWRLQRFALPDANARTLAAALNLQIICERAAQQGAINLVVKGDDEKGINAFGMRRFGQRPGDIGKAAGFGKGDRFR